VADGQGRGSAATRAHEWIRAAIVRGDLAPGRMLSENELAADLEMSRTPVRSALARLQDEGWVTIYPQRGALVRELSDAEVREAAEVRHALESAGIQRSDPTRRDGLVDRLAGNLEEQEAALADGDFPRFTTLASDFHRAFVEMAGNAVMLEVYDRLRDRQLLTMVRSAPRISAAAEQVVAEHRTLLADARRGDWTAFATHLEDHQARNHGPETGVDQRG
jgi:DNA-binding GntR family transcriptional regulator